MAKPFLRLGGLRLLDILGDLWYVFGMAGKKTEGYYIAMVRRDGLALKDVPEAARTEAVCLAAVREHGKALEFVPELLKTEVFRAS